uniref:Replication protein E1 n=1 Tax=Bat papillomavirus TaxID=2004707 RepID=A0A2Z2JL10_9PAPI|nr:E1 [Bat papillomavirus]
MIALVLSAGPVAEGDTTMAEGNEWCLIEAECSDDGEDEDEDEFDELFEQASTDLIDDNVVQQGNSLELFQLQESEEQVQRVQEIKRKLKLSPEIDSELSPRLKLVQISEHTPSAKKRLFSQPDSGFEASGNETPVLARTQRREVDEPDSVRAASPSFCKTLLKSFNQKACALGQFKALTGVSFRELTREYKSERTMNCDWLLGILDLKRATAESIKEWLLTVADFFLWHFEQTERDTCLTVLVKFKAQKCRETIIKQLNTYYRFASKQLILADPPKIASPACALYFVKVSSYPSAVKHGDYPEWLERQVSITHRFAAETPFSLSAMIQWAYDNDITDESKIAYDYAALADEDNNAQAFLNSNHQARIVKDVRYMVTAYKRAEMRAMSTSAYIHHCLNKIEGEGDWRIVPAFLKYQGLNFFTFLTALKKFFAGIPKHTCIVIYGPSDTGKSYFASSFLKAVQGKVLSYTPNSSHFWLSPLANSKVCLLDDATRSAWSFMDNFMRNALDGAPICVDCKHKAPEQVICPPMLITTNVDLTEETCWRHLCTRLTIFTFKNALPFTSTGSPLYDLSPKNWKAFLHRFWSHLDLSDQEDDSDAEASRPLRLNTRNTTENL